MSHPETTADREDGVPPRCKWGDGPCQNPQRCRETQMCEGARAEFDQDRMLNSVGV